MLGGINGIHDGGLVFMVLGAADEQLCRSTVQPLSSRVVHTAESISVSVSLCTCVHVCTCCCLFLQLAAGCSIPVVG